MELNIDLKKIWNNQSVNYSNVEEIYAKAKQVQQKLKRKAAAAISLMALPFLVIIACIIFEWNDLSDSSTQIIWAETGFGFILIALLFFGFDMLQFVLLIKKMNAASNLSPLQQTIKIKNKFNSGIKIRLACLVLDCAGVIILLLLIFADMQLPVFWRIVFCALVFVLFIFAWLFKGKKKFAKQNADLNSIIEQLQKLTN